MAADFGNFPFEFSVQGDPGHELPEAYFSIIPFRTSKFKHLGAAVSEIVAEDWKRCTGEQIDTSRIGVLTSRGHAFSYCFPEIPEDRFAPLAHLIETIIAWDDAADILDHETQCAVVDDLVLGFLQLWKMKTPSQFDFKINSALANALICCPALKSNDQMPIPISRVYEMAKSLPVKTTDMSLESYKELREKSSGSLYYVNHLIPYLTDTGVSEEERASVQHIFSRGALAASLLNDLYSFPREFDDHLKAGTLDMIHNAMAVLMSGYGYTEEEATSILKQEISAAEHDIMDKYTAWEQSSAPKSERLRQYVVYSILALGGIIYWMSHSQRYYRDDITASAEDRAQLVGECNDRLKRLEGYPPPAASIQASSEPHERELNGNSPAAPRSTTHKSNVEDALANLLVPFKSAVVPGDEICSEPYQYIVDLPGKRTLAKCVDNLQEWLHLPLESLQIIKRVAVRLFTSTLMLDDIEDGSALRRGHPASHVLFGLSQTVNSATYAVIKALMDVETLQEKKCRDVFVDGLQSLCNGQGLELYWRFHGTCPSPEDYITMIDNKTGSFFKLLVELMETESRSTPNPNLLQLTTLIGRYYQIRDDYNNLASDEYTATKGFCDDLNEGKFSLPLIHLLQHSQSADRIRGLLRNRGPNTEELSPQLKTWILSEMKSAGSLDYVAEITTRLHEKILETLDLVEAEMGRNKKMRIFVIGLK